MKSGRRLKSACQKSKMFPLLLWDVLNFHATLPLLFPHDFFPLSARKVHIFNWVVNTILRVHSIDLLLNREATFIAIWMFLYIASRVLIISISTATSSNCVVLSLFLHSSNYSKDCYRKVWCAYDLRIQIYKSWLQETFELRHSLKKQVTWKVILQKPEEYTYNVAPNYIQM